MIGLLLGGTALVAGLVLAGVVLWTRVGPRRVQAWPAVTGRVVRSNVEPVHADGAGDTLQGYRPVICYEYEVAGLPYAGRRIAASARPPVLASRGAATSIAERYPAGAAVAVRFNPASPSEALLEAGGRGPALPWLVAGALIALGLGLLTAAGEMLQSSPR